MKNLTALDVAKYFLAQLNEESGDTVSNLKLQKLLYYAQGFHLAILGSPLFQEKIIAWAHGPVVQSVYDQYSKHGARAIPKPKLVDFAIYPQKSREVMDEVYQVYGQFSAWKLRNMTHDEPPWRDTRRNCTISRVVMAEHFKTQLAS